MSTRQHRYLLANRIIELARASRFQVDYHLREQQLADTLQVSRTPVRAALTLLQAHGVVTAHKNKGFFMRIGADQLERIEIDVPSSAQQTLYARIVQDRLTGKLGETITKTEMLRRYAVSHHVLQKTLSALIADGLVTRGPGQRWVFQPTLDNPVALQASYAFRRIIEPAGLLLQSFRMHPTTLEHLRREHMNVLARPNVDGLPAKQLFELDANFHETIAQCSGNTFILQAIQHQNRLRRLLEFASYTNAHRIREWCQEHLRILTAIQEDDSARAAACMHRHLDKARTHVQ